MSQPAIILRDSTLREGLDTPGVSFSMSDKLAILDALAAAGVPEAEVVAPSRVLSDLELVRQAKARGVNIKTSGLVYAGGKHLVEELAAAAECLDHFDVLMPLSPQRAPSAPADKIAAITEVLTRCPHEKAEVGVGFPHSTQAPADFLLEISTRAVEAGARRVIVYDTHGGTNPDSVGALIAQLVAHLDVPIWFHGHNDLGMATANSRAAVHAGCAGLDVTVNGLGDRAGNASLEQIALVLHLEERRTGIRPTELGALSRLVERLSGVTVSKLAPIVGDFVFAHKSPSHLTVPDEFEAFDPAVVGASRSIEAPPPPKEPKVEQ